ncbi:MAG: hypothetical protein C4523_11365 [Myxococcales bacterium]|nr:MAG: hypothetical protein C4523_11365 [Myxococcales bacterium]
MPARFLHRSLIFAAFVAALGCVFAPPAAAQQQAANDIERELDDVESRLAELRGKYVAPLEGVSGQEFERRYYRAVALYRDGDYDHSSIIMQDLAEVADAKNRPEYYNLIWYLGDGLTKNKTYATARDYLQQVANYGSSYPHYRDAMANLIGIAVEQGRLDEAERLYRQVAQYSGDLGYDLIQYAFAKSLYGEGEIDRALIPFRQIPENSDYYPAAQYFVGAILVQQGDLDGALAAFDGIHQLALRDPRQVKVQELSYLASARILFEKKIYDKALSLYRKVPLESEYFDQAYYEICWIYIQTDRFAEAANTLEILLLAFPNSMYGPNSEVLKGNILLWQEKFSPAAESFQNVINNYTHVVDVMDNLVKVSAGKKAEEIQKQILGRQDTLPPVVLSWLSRQGEVAAALAVTKTIERGRQDVEQSNDIIAVLDSHLSQQAKANLFPTLKEGRENGLELSHRLTEARRRLSEIGANLAGGQAFALDRQRLEQLRAERRKLEAAYATVPKTRKDRRLRQQRQLERMEEVDKSVYQLRIQLKGIDELMAELEGKADRIQTDAELSPRYLEEVKAEADNSKNEIEGLVTELERLQGNIAASIEQTKIGDETDRRDEAVRQEIERVLAEEKEILSRMRNSMSASDQAFFDRVETVRNRSDRLDAALVAYFNDLETLVADRVAGFASAVEQEKNRLFDYQLELTRHEEEGARLAAEIANENLRTVHEHFYEVVLKANLGLVDIAWEKRQKVRDEIDRLLEKLSDEKKHLANQFKELQRED